MQRWILVLVICAATALPPSVRSGEMMAEAPVEIRDLALAADGSLHGVVMTAAGQPQPGAEVPCGVEKDPSQETIDQR